MERNINRIVTGVIATGLIVVAVFFVACTNVGSSTAPTMLEIEKSSSPQIHWGPAPAVFPPGAQMAVIQGDPSAPEPFIVRLRFPNGYKIMPHTHPTDENITVISGTFKVGMGDAFEELTMLALPAGGFVTAPALHAHYAMAQGVTTVQVNAVGPFALTYVNPKDLPKHGSN